MKNFYCNLFIFLAFLFSLEAQAQESAQQDTSRMDKEYANPSVEGTPRGRFFILRYQRLFSHDFNSTGDWKNLPVNSDAKINTNNIAEIKGFVPLWNNPHFKAVLGVGYEREEFNFEHSNELGYLYHENLQDKGLKSLSAQIGVVKPLDYKNYLVMRVKGALNGDYTSDELNFNDYLKVTAEALYGWKKSKYFSWGIGAQAGYTFGRFSVYPAILYNRTYNDKWGVEAIIPAAIKVRRTFSEKSYLYMGYNLEGYSYNIKVQKPPFYQSPVFGEIRTVELRHNDLKVQLRWEKEIYDFLCCLAYWLYYERIMYAEEEFLRKIYGAEYETWAERTPAFLPALSGWVSTSASFSFKNVLKREYNGLFAMFFSFAALNAISYFIYEGRFFMDTTWQLLLLLGTGMFVLLRFLRKNTKLLDEPGR